jgi:hypothetical protein
LLPGQVVGWSAAPDTRMLAQVAWLRAHQDAVAEIFVAAT